MTDVVLAGVLGAVVLAVVLLHKARKRDRAVITQLRAEMAAQQIAALTQTGPMLYSTEETAEGEPQEPARRKRHLALYIGGGVAAFIAFTGERARSLWKNHRTATASVTAASLAVAAAGAFALTSTEGTSPTKAVPSVTAPGAPDVALEAAPEAASDTASDGTGVDVANGRGGAAFEPTQDGRGTSVTTGDNNPKSPPGADATPGTPRPPTPGDEDQTEPSDAAPPPGDSATTGPPAAPTNAPPAPGTPTPTKEPAVPPTQQPANEPPKPPTKDDCTLPIKLPPLLDLCLL
ncbi:hypothetical protein ACFYSJ_04780 [Streptomyces sp. NPDC005248]|uniref:hypothetical protein n=1 Tax=Streptomyces sp. NPDC005248 TaxID=3364709 RepID=UPI0036879E93